VLAGLVNKQLVAELNALGGRAAGICGADGPTVLAEVTDAEYGRVGQVREIRTALLKSLLAAGFVPVISPVGIEVRASPDPLPHEGARTNGASSNGAAAEEGKALTGEAVASDDLPALVGRGQAVGGLLNINADSVAGEIAAALGATRLIFLTDVPGVKDAGGAFVTALDADECEALIQSGAIGGGMIPKVEACVRAADAGVVAMIVDGREADALQRVLDGSANGTRIG